MKPKFANRIADEASQSGESMFANCSEATMEVVQENPVMASMIAFGVGIGIGALIGASMAGTERSRRSTAESVGRRVLASLTDYLPESIQHQFR